MSTQTLLKTAARVLHPHVSVILMFQVTFSGRCIGKESSIPWPSGVPFWCLWIYFGVL